MPTVEVAGRLEFSPPPAKSLKRKDFNDLFVREVPRRLDVDDGARFAVGTRQDTSNAKTYNVGGMCDWFFIPRTKGIGRISSGGLAYSHRLSDNAENKDTPDKPSSSAAA